MATSEEQQFDASLLSAKKKKKVKKIDFDAVLGLGTNDAESAPAAADASAGGGDGDDGGFSAAASATVPSSGGQSDIMDSLESFGQKKKKKAKKVELSVDNNDAAAVENVGDAAGGGEEELGLDFGPKKKNKKKTKKILSDINNDDVNEDFVEEQQEDLSVVVVIDAGDDDDGIMIEMTEGGEGGETTGGVSMATTRSETKTWLSSDRDYTYDELLTRVFEIMHAKNPEMASGTKQKFVMRPPQVLRVGTKKTSFVNFKEICKMLHRHEKHLLDFLLSELGTSGSIDGNNQLIIKGKFQQKQIENVLRRYIKEYVTCHTCRSPNTILQKDSRIFFLRCEACGSSCSVASIKHGFQAVTSKRAAMRAKAT